MSMGPVAMLGGGLSLVSSDYCECAAIDPIDYPPNPCCTGNGNGGGNGGTCSGDGNGGNGGNGGSGGGNGDGTGFFCNFSAYGGLSQDGARVSGNLLNGAVVLPLVNAPPGSGSLCVTALSGIAPVQPPTGPYSIQVRTFFPGGQVVVEGLQLTCVESGVSLTSTCSTVTFSFTDSAAKHFSTPGGVGIFCTGGGSRSFTSGSGSGTGMVDVDVTPVF